MGEEREEWRQGGGLWRISDEVYKRADSFLAAFLNENSYFLVLFCCRLLLYSSERGSLVTIWKRTSSNFLICRENSITVISLRPSTKKKKVKKETFNRNSQFHTRRRGFRTMRRCAHRYLRAMKTMEHGLTTGKHKRLPSRKRRGFQTMRRYAHLYLKAMKTMDHRLTTGIHKRLPPRKHFSFSLIFLFSRTFLFFICLFFLKSFLFLSQTFIFPPTFSEATFASNPQKSK